ncbi:MAG: methyltransferase MtaB domain-containing protein, partial [Verrucomicrobiota bacterium]
ARVIVGSDTHYHAGAAVARKAVELLRSAHAGGKLRVAPNELVWFDSMQETLDELPESETEFIARQLALADRKRFLPEEYGLKAY